MFGVSQVISTSLMSVSTQTDGFAIEDDDGSHRDIASVQCVRRLSQSHSHESLMRVMFKQVIHLRVLALTEN